jgi:predicted ATPase
LLGLKVPDDALAGLDSVLIGLRTRELFAATIGSPVPSVAFSHGDRGFALDRQCVPRTYEAKLRLLLLTTRRPEYAPPWLNRTVVTKLGLEPLPVGHIRRLIQARLGVDVLPEALARQVVEKSEVNPLFTEEMVCFLTVRGLVRTAAGKLDFDASAVATALPASLHSLLTARVDRLVPQDRTLLQAASVIGRKFDSQWLAVVVGQSDTDARLAAMQALDLIRLDGKSGG